MMVPSPEHDVRLVVAQKEEFKNGHERESNKATVAPNSFTVTFSNCVYVQMSDSLERQMRNRFEI